MLAVLTRGSRAGWIGAVLFVTLAAAEDASAQGPGLRAGVGLVSKGFIGAHYDVRIDQSDPAADTPHRARVLWFRPSVEVTLGGRKNDFWPDTMVNLEFRIQRPITSRWAHYSGTGLTISRYQSGGRYGFGTREASWRKGIELVGGIASRRGTFIEAKVDPSLIKFGIGYTFGRQ